MPATKGSHGLRQRLATKMATMAAASLGLSGVISPPTTTCSYRLNSSQCEGGMPV